jgi:hypothetical protein
MSLYQQFPYYTLPYIYLPQYPVGQASTCSLVYISPLSLLPWDSVCKIYTHYRTLFIKNTHKKSDIEYVDVVTSIHCSYRIKQALWSNKRTLKKTSIISIIRITSSFTENNFLKKQNIAIFCLLRIKNSCL